MKNQEIKKAGEVTVTTMEWLSEFERTSVQILGNANNLYDSPTLPHLPKNVENLFSNKFSRYYIIDLITIFASSHLRPIVRHQTTCPCVGADENIFSNILKFSLENQETEVSILGSLLIKSCQLHNLVKKSKIVAFLIDEELKKNALGSELNHTVCNNHLH